MYNEDETLRESILDERRTLLLGKYEERRGSGRKRVFIMERQECQEAVYFGRQEVLGLGV